MRLSVRRHVKKIEEKIVGIIPTRAMKEIANITNYIHLDLLDLNIEDVSSIYIDNMPVEADGENLYLDSHVDTYIQRSKALRTIRARFDLYMNTETDVIKTSVKICTVVHSGNNIHDQFVMAICYEYAKGLFKLIDFKSFGFDSVEFPVDYSELSDSFKEHYDGYIETRNKKIVSSKVNDGPVISIAPRK